MEMTHRQSQTPALGKKDSPHPLDRGLAALVTAIQEREVSAVEIIRASLDRIEQDNPRLNAFITINEKEAIAEAQAADEQLRAGRTLGPLHGVPVGIKDLVATKGLRTTSGSTIFRDNIPEKDDLVVARLRSCGAIIIGKTNTPEFGFGAVTDNQLCGPTRNPYDERLTSGGSSGGSAVAVAAGMVPLAHGTDFGGSVRTPASFCGVVGIRPTPGVIPNTSKKLPWDAIFTHGAIARTVEDAAELLRAMSGGDRYDPVSAARLPLSQFEWDDLNLSGWRVAFSPNLGIATIAQEVKAVFGSAVDAMSTLGIRLEKDHPDCTLAQESFETIRGAMLYDSLGQYLESGFGQLSPTVAWNVDRGRHTSAKAFLQAEANRGRVYRSFIEFFERYDILATVAASVTPFPIEQSNVLEIDGAPLRNIIDYLTVTYVISLVGHPAITIPCGWIDGELPIGIQLIAKPFDEIRLLKFAYALQEKLGFRFRPISKSPRTR